MSFDVGVGLSEAALSEASASLYTALYPRFYKGSGDVEWKGGIVRADWDVRKAPAFDLSMATEAPAILEEAFLEAGAAAANATKAASAAGEFRTLAAALAAAVPSFRLRFADVRVILTSSGSPSPPFLLDLTAWCHIEVRGMNLALVADKVTAAKQSDELAEWVVQRLLVPRITAMAKDLCAGIVIPPIATPVPLTPPAVAVVDRRLVAVANLSWRGMPAPPTSGAGLPASKFFALLARGAVQAFAELALQNIPRSFEDRGSGGDWWAGYRWHFSVRIGSPVVRLEGTDVLVSLSYGGSAWAGVTLLGVEIGIGYESTAAPNPSVRLATAVTDGKLRATASEVPPFAVLVRATGPIGDLIPAWILSAIVSGITGAAALAVTVALRGLAIVSYDIPIYSLAVAGVTLRATPKNLSVANANDALALQGELGITAA